MCSPVLPASSSSTLTPAAASRPAMAQPAEPPPTTMISGSPAWDMERPPRSDQRVVAQAIAVGAPLADPDEDVLGQPVVLADAAFEARVAAQVVFLVRHRRAVVEGP